MSNKNTKNDLKISLIFIRVAGIGTKFVNCFIMILNTYHLNDELKDNHTMDINNNYNKSIVITHYKDNKLLSYVQNVYLLPHIFKSKIQNKFQILISIIVNTFKLIKLSKNYELYITTSLIIAIATLLACKIKDMSNKKYLLTNFYLHQLGENKIIIAILKFLFDNLNITIAVQSKYEQNIYKGRFPNIETIFIAYCQDPLQNINCKAGNYVFTGGYTNRDYDTLLKCARDTQSINYVIVCSYLNSINEKIPHNVKIIKDVSNDEFNLHLAGCKIVVISLKEQVGASGQMLALTAMSLMKPIIYSKNEAISYYFKDNHNALSYSPGDFLELKNKIHILMNNEALQEKLAINAFQNYINNYTKIKYMEKINSSILNLLLNK